MNWKVDYIKLAARSMPLSEALRALGLNKLPSTPDELKNIYRKRTKETHPDRGGTTEKSVLVNLAYEVCEKAIESGGQPSQENPFDFVRPGGRSGSVPPWQTDLRSSYNSFNESEPIPQAWRNQNRCKADIYKKAEELGGASGNFTFWTLDGRFQRGMMTVKCNPATFEFAGEVVEYWVSKGANSYRVDAVFVNLPNNELLCVRVHGKACNEPVPFVHDSDNTNPANDPHFMDELAAWVAKH